MSKLNNSLDRRVNKTVAALRSALTELIVEKHYDTITVQDIIDRANVGRSTFYTHFRDKEDLLMGDWKKVLTAIAAHVDLGGVDQGRLAPVEGLMMHLKDYHAFYRGLVRSGKAERLFTTGVEFLGEKIEEKLKAHETAGHVLTVPAAVCAHYIALNIFGMLKWWLDRHMPYSPAEMGKMFHELIAPGVSRILRAEPASGRYTASSLRSRDCTRCVMHIDHFFAAFAAPPRGVTSRASLTLRSPSLSEG